MKTLIPSCAVGVALCAFPLLGFADVGSPAHGAREGYDSHESHGGVGSGSSSSDGRCQSGARESGGGDRRSSECTQSAHSDRGLSDKLSQSAKETRGYAERKEAEAREHQAKADRLNDRVQGKDVPAAQDNLERAAARGIGDAAKAIGDYRVDAPETTALEAAGIAKDLGKALDRRDQALLEVGDPDLTAERDREQATADAAKKEAAAARQLSNHLEDATKDKAGHKTSAHSTRSALQPMMMDSHGRK